MSISSNLGEASAYDELGTCFTHINIIKQKRLLLFTAALFGLVLTASCKNYPVEPPEKKSIVILFENDVHCSIDGYARLAGLRDAIDDTAWTGLVSSGDFLQGGVSGTISHGQYIVEIMRTMKYDAIGLGNHEFDYGMVRLIELFKGFNAPIVCCNLYDINSNRLYNAYTVRSYGHRKVGFVGLVTPDSEVTERYSFYYDNGQQLYTLHPADYTALVQQAVDAARADGADYVVLLSHMGENNGESPFTSNDLIASTSGINAVFDAHSHSVIDTVLLNRVGEPVLLANTGTKFKNVGKLYISPEGRMDITLIPSEQISAISSTVNNAVDRVNQQVDHQVGYVVAHSEVPINISDSNGNRLVRNSETNAGDLVSDALRWYTGADIGLINGGGIRTDLPAGDITYANIISLLPFEDIVWKIEVSGAQILSLLQMGTSKLPDENGDFPQVSGLKYTVSVDSLTLSNVEVLQTDGTYLPLNTSARYTISTIDYGVTGGGFGNSLAGCDIILQTNTVYSDALVQYITDVLDGVIGQQYAVPQGRITIQ